MSFGGFSPCVQGSYWAIDTNPKEDALPTRPKKRPRSGERVSVNAAHFPVSAVLSVTGAPDQSELPASLDAPASPSLPRQPVAKKAPYS